MLLQPTGLAHPYHWDAFGDSGWGGRLAPTTATPLATVGGWRTGGLAAGSYHCDAFGDSGWGGQPGGHNGHNHVLESAGSVSCVSLCSQSLSYVVGVGLREHDICACAGAAGDARAEASAGAGAGAEISTQARTARNCHGGQVPFLQL